MRSVYIETTIPSFYYDSRRSPRIVTWRDATRLWWDRYRFGYQICTSLVTRAELSLSPPEKAKRALKMLDEAELLDEPPELVAVADYYIEQHAMPREAGGDAFHLAMASIHHVDFLLTWNCQHLANANKIQHLTILNRQLGLPTPVITTPLTLIPEEQT